MSSRTIEIQKKAHAMRRTLEGGGGFTKPRRPAQLSRIEKTRLAHAIRRSVEG